MFKKLGKLFKKLWDAIRKVLAILLVIVAVILICFFTFGSGLLVIPFLGIALTPTMALLAGVLALTCAFIIDADTSSEVVGAIGDALGSAAKAIGSATGSVIDGAVSGLLSSPVLMWGLIAVGAYLLLSDDGDNGKSVRAGETLPPADRDPLSEARPSGTRSKPKIKPNARSGDLSDLLLA